MTLRQLQKVATVVAMVDGTRSGGKERRRLETGYKGTDHQMSAMQNSRYATEPAHRRNVSDLSATSPMGVLAKALDGKLLQRDDQVTGT